MPVEDVFTITGRGTVATGRVERGTVKINETVQIVGLAEATRSVVVTGVEMFRKQLDQALAGDNVGLLLRGVQRTDIERGQVLAKPNSIHPHTHFVGRVYVLSKEEGGRHTPFFSGYRPQFYFRTTDVTGTIELPAGVEMVMPGDHIDMTIRSRRSRSNRDFASRFAKAGVRLPRASSPKCWTSKRQTQERLAQAGLFFITKNSS